jgi:anti-sigma factor RsiW
MNLRIFRGSDPVHRATQELLPWYVNGTLEGDERAQVEAHLSACLPCRRELEAQRALQTALSVSPRDPELTQALARMHVHLDAAERGPLLGLMRRLWHGSHPLLRGALALQLVVILGLAAALALRPPAEYRTLSSQPAGTQERTGIAVIFNDGRGEQEVRNLLAQLRLRIVDGPTDAGAYTLEVDAGRRDAVVAALSRHAAVRLALPVSLPQGSAP